MASHVLFGVAFDADCVLALPENDEGERPRFTLKEDQQFFDRERIPAETINHGDWVSYSRFDGGEVLIKWHDLLDLWVSADGKLVKYRRHNCCTDECFAAYIANFAISNVLTLQGEETLHATVVRLRNRTVALLGDSGAGKSTLAAYLLSQGAQIVTDDMLRLSEIDGGCFAEPGQPRIKLFRSDAERLLPQALELGHWNAFSDKYIFLPQDPTERRECTSLDALIFLGSPVLSDDRGLHMERVRGAAAFELLTASTMNRSFRTPERFRTQLAFAAKVAARVPLYTLNYTRDYNLLPAVAEHIDATLALDLL